MDLAILLYRDVSRAFIFLKSLATQPFFNSLTTKKSQQITCLIVVSRTYAGKMINFWLVGYLFIDLEPFSIEHFQLKMAVLMYVHWHDETWVLLAIKNGFLYVLGDDQSIDITVKWHYSYSNSCASYCTWTELIFRETVVKSSDVGWLISLNVKSIHTFTPVYLKIAIYRQTQHAVHKCQSYMLPLYQSYR